MKWQEIKEKYPNAHKEAMKFVTDITKEVAWYPHNRWLYDFFDENGIYIILYISIHYTGSIQSGFKLIWGKTRRDELFDYTIYNSRTEAEIAAFTKAFEMLETKLK